MKSKIAQIAAAASRLGECSFSVEDVEDILNRQDWYADGEREHWVRSQSVGELAEWVLQESFRSREDYRGSEEVIAE